MTGLCSYATIHWIRFGEARTPDMLDLSRRPESCAAWKIGPDGQAAADGSRKPSDIWCAIGFYRDLAAAEAAMDDAKHFLPFLDDAEEYWQVLLRPVSHKGECNHLDASCAGPMFETAGDSGGPMVVMTTAGFDLGSGFDLRRVVAFRQSVDDLRDVVAGSEGCIAHQVFAPHTRGDDGVTMSIWKDKDSMTAFAYRAGAHRDRIDQHKASAVMDRSSFTRFRPVRSGGTWGGSDPLAGCKLADVG